MAAGKQRSPHSKGCRWLLMSGEEVRGWAADDEIGGKRGRCLGELVGEGCRWMLMPGGGGRV